MSGILSAADLPACRCGELATLDQCYFEPLSSCTWRDALQDTEEPRCIKSPTMVMLADLSAITLAQKRINILHTSTSVPSYLMTIREGPSCRQFRA